ncbi:CDP-diacylglycerol--serine O-phosphatidyltransferase [Alicyclobacillus acidocaldarius]|uniref:CDP-diacylglycerol--serine O-phosphatidyltransferase n=1 Tax=Alicyclobacillus acidocaldarius subsp. acidocaldarius (strain ATCC 27009 / DSM 446 / BCRC 14685 / JCM 5260 / KCTC 1825 / NBRC 15652 / NCIMB 11725 / NRRL B-14509 / 104-IA) TaxID=521098 RepID=C8WTZ9_ALIAD|nr:CDP-diacylglycerol--serine O-phosphatidyltransferase [Alicyclobacillus acidocaldarius]ACV59741.1 CDP-diacylglycerol/serineO-phosphatidyltransfera se [Alicyclobacillus acidocaldarius subsp. acidocaldarius DSM 446]
MYIRWIPNALTALNLVAGLSSMLILQAGRVGLSALFVVFGMIIDGLDGRVARWLRAESEFGRILDSLSDIVTFGVAPAMIMYRVELRHLGILGDLVAILFPLCGALRLARFHTQRGPADTFIGLPITAAGGVEATLALTQSAFEPASIILSAATVLLSLLMVSSIPYPNFKRLSYPKSILVLVPLFALLIACILRFQIVGTDVLIFAVLGLYAAYGMVHAIRSSIVARKHGDGDMAHGTKK